MLAAGCFVAWIGNHGQSCYGQTVDFDVTIRPILTEHCHRCHSRQLVKGGLRLDAPSLARQGGDSGEIIVPGKSDASELLRRVSTSDVEERMPPDGDALTESQVAAIREWIDQGARWDETETDRLALRDPRLEHWAWQPIRAVQMPASQKGNRESTSQLNEIDEFVLGKLQEHGLTLSAEADRRTLIRRLAFDLWGLPPTPEQIARFLSDDDPNAYEHLVDSMLASPNYGERWARHWLDIAHYADTHGFERDQRRDNAWPYRDWVIRSLNADMPYDEFIREQIAGDVFHPDNPDSVIATGFLAAGPWDFVGQAETPSPVLKRLARGDDLDDMVTQVMTSTCAVTINCARCHDHKLDPIAQREYYSLWSVFAGVKRADRFVSIAEKNQNDELRKRIEGDINTTRTELAQAQGNGWSLADIVGSGNGLGTGKVGQGIDPAAGKSQADKRAFLEGISVNQYFSSDVRFVDGTVVPDGGGTGQVPVTSTGIFATGIPKTSGRVWDAIRNGPVNSQFSTKFGDIDYAAADHALLAIHANAAITFDLNEMRQEGLPGSLTFSSLVGYFGETPKNGASAHVLLDGKLAWQGVNLGRSDGVVEAVVSIPETARFLTLMATDAGNDIGHDQICFADAFLKAAQPASTQDTARIDMLSQKLRSLKDQLAAIPEPQKVYSIASETPPVINLLARGDTEQPREPVLPGTVACVTSLPSSLGDEALPEGERRRALSEWITSAANPLTPRVIVNRLWHHHFGAGLVDTPSDFGLGGNAPSNPELLDWLANRFMQDNWSLKSTHRLICTSATYRQSATRADGSANAQGLMAIARNADTSNRLLWRQNARRLEAEAFRDSVMRTAGTLNLQMFGPGYRDFNYQEEYAPVYTYITPDKPELWRRTIYRFAVRTTPQQFLATMDCPNFANLTPVRNVTTTALQSLAVLNDEFMIQQATHFAKRLEFESPNPNLQSQLQLAFQLAFGRLPSDDELHASMQLAQTQGLVAVCRMLFAANEFVYID
jgi:mono/diheme cytochrome c family protein